MRSWGRAGSGPYTVIIDNLMNLELLFWGAKNGGSADWRDMAHEHALTSMRDHVRADGSTFHVVDYDPDTGEPVGRRTNQGFAHDVDLVARPGVGHPRLHHRLPRDA